MKSLLKNSGLFTLLMLIVLIALQPFVSVAQPGIITDTTTGTATNDGTVTVEEYAGCTSGINSGFGGFLGANSQLCVDSSEAGALNFGLIKGGSDLGNAVVIYLDTTTGGFASTANFTDDADGLRKAISGKDGNNSSVLTFAPGFAPEFAIAFEQNFGGLWQLQENGSHTFVKSVNLNPTGNINANTYEVNLLLSDIGLSAGDPFKYVANYISLSAYRSNEFHGVAAINGSGDGAGNFGWNPATLAQGDYNIFNSYSSTTTPTPTDTLAPTNTPIPTDTPTEVPTNTPTDVPTEVPTNTPTSTSVPVVELLSNGGMETDADTNKIPDDWTGKNLLGDKLKCDDVTKVHSGLCAFQFKGGVAENSQLVQNTDLTGLVLVAGQNVTLSGWYKAPKATASGKFLVKIKYSDAVNGKINLPIVSAADYVNVTNSVILTTANVTVIKLQIIHTSPSGKVWVDDVSLTVGE